MAAEGGAMAEEIDPQSAREAVAWLTQLMSDEADGEDKDGWQRWLAASPENARAWQHISRFSSQFSLLNGEAAHRSLSTVANPQRRRLLRCAAGLGLIGAVGAGTLPWRSWQADYRTATGVQQRVTLSDGTDLLLNTQTAVNVRLPQLRLLQGEMLVASPRSGMPLQLSLPQGSVQAHNSRFSLRLRDDYSELAVYHGQLSVTPLDGRRITLNAGYGGRLNLSGFREVGRVSGEPGWQQGMLYADNMRLDDFIAELGRYRRGVIRCGQQVAGLRLSGAFPLADTDRIIASLPGTLPVQVSSLSKYFISIS